MAGAASVERNALRFGAEIDEGGQYQSSECGNDCKRKRINTSVGTGDSCLKWGIRRGQQISELIGKAGKRAAY